MKIILAVVPICAQTLQQGNPAYANSFSESTWPQNPAIRYPGATTSFGGLSATSINGNAAPSNNFGAYVPYGGGTPWPFNKPWAPIAPLGELAVLTDGATGPITPITPTTAQLQLGASFGLSATPSISSAASLSNNFGAYVPYGGDTPWPFNKPWTPVAPSGELAVLTNGATGPITPIVPATAQVQLGQMFTPPGTPVPLASSPIIGASAVTSTPAAPSFASFAAPVQSINLSNPTGSSVTPFYPPASHSLAPLVPSQAPFGNFNSLPSFGAASGQVSGLQSQASFSLSQPIYTPSQPQFTPSQPRPVLSQWQSQPDSFGQAQTATAVGQPFQAPSPAQGSSAFQSQTQAILSQWPSIGHIEGSAFVGQSQPLFGSAQSFVQPAFGASQMSSLPLASSNAVEEGPTGMPLMLYN